MKQTLIQILGVQHPVSATEKVVALSGAAWAIGLVMLVSVQLTGYHGTMAILPSMGAAAVLLFAVPHGVLSQPWALFAGNFFSAIIGVTCATFIGDSEWAASLAVGLSIVIMYMARCVHPPGGATALAAVIGGHDIQSLGYGYVVVPVMLNCSVIFIVAVIYNYGFSWRRYPLAMMRYKTTAPVKTAAKEIQARHIETAMDHMDMLLDVSAEQIKEVLEKAQLLLRDERIEHLHVELGAFYTNAKPGLRWSVRQIIDESKNVDPHKHMLIYRTVDGNNRSSTDSCSLAEFSDWAKEKMQPARDNEKHTLP